MPTQVYAVVHDGRGNFLLAVKNKRGYFFHTRGDDGKIVPDGQDLNGAGEAALPGGRLANSAPISGIPIKGAVAEFREETGVQLPPGAAPITREWRHDDSWLYWAVYFDVGAELENICRAAAEGLRIAALAAEAVRNDQYGTGQYRALRAEFAGCPQDNELATIEIWNIEKHWEVIQTWQDSKTLGWYYNILLHFKQQIAIQFTVTSTSTTGEEQPMSTGKNAIEQIYDQLMQVFGGTNPNQFFTLLMPATTLNQADYAYDTTQSKPALVAAAESLLADQMFDIAKVSGSSNGERLSSQYLQALSVLVPTFDPIEPAMKNALRTYINSPAPPNSTLGGKPFTGSLREYYFALYQQWLAIKSQWDMDITAQKNTLSAEKFLEWYEDHADGRLAEIDAAEGELLAVFSPSDMEAILGALESGPGGEFEEALVAVQDVRVPSPSGGYNYPIDLIPDDWFLDLASDMNPADLLQDPQFIALTISARRTAIMASISQLQALLAQAPTPDEMKAAADKLATAQNAYTAAQNALLNTYAANTATAVEMYLDAETGGAASDAGSVLTALNQNAAAVSKAKGDTPPDTAAKKKDGTALTTADVQAILQGQQKLIAAQSALLTSSQALADAGMNLASDQARTFGAAPVMLARLQSQLNDLQAMQAQAGVSAAAAANNPPAAPLLSTALMAGALAVAAAINNANTTGATPAAVQTAITTAISAVTDATAKAALAVIATAAATAANDPGATGASVAGAALAAAAPLTGAPSAAKAQTSERFMALQFSFTSSDMESTTSSDTQFSQLSWGVDLFFGSASGQNSQSSAVSSNNAFDASTTIEIGLKAAKVDINRGWFNPGVFKLTEAMNRLTTAKVSLGPVDFKNDDLTAANASILPCFPVAFVVAKDVTIRFQASTSVLSAVQSVVDSRSASGGGFLCFSVSSSSGSHSDYARMSSKSEGTVITISMPGPQILGWFLEFTPSDLSNLMTTTSTDDGELSIIDFVNQLKLFGAANPS